MCSSLKCKKLGLQSGQVVMRPWLKHLRNDFVLLIQLVEEADWFAETVSLSRPCLLESADITTVFLAINLSRKS